jgi:hypothetical protein
MANIIIKKNDGLGKTRSEHEENLRKVKYLERKIKDKTGSAKNFIRGQDIDKVK